MPEQPTETVDLLGWRFRREPGQDFTPEDRLGYWAMRMVVASRAVYREPCEIPPHHLHEDPDSVVFFDHGSTQAYCYRSEGHLCLVFRGTEKGNDVLTDLTTWLQGEPALHLGFEIGWRNVRADVERWLESIAEPRPPLILAGHSLGGALAIVAAFHLNESHPVAGVFTFGAPRTGAANFAGAYASQISSNGRPLSEVTWRFRHAGDPVSIIPPPIVYRHVGEQFTVKTHLTRERPNGLKPDTPSLLEDLVVTVTRGSIGAQLLGVGDQIFAATPYIAIVLTLAGFGMLALSEHWSAVVAWLAWLGSLWVAQIIVTVVCIAALQQLTYLVPRMPGSLRWLIAVALFAGAWSLGWTSLVGAQIGAWMIVFLTFAGRMLLPYAPDHRILRYQEGLAALDGPWSQSLDPNFSLYRSLGLDPFTQVIRTWVGKRM